MTPGATLAGRFTIERLAGTGGMGSVYAARDITTGHPVALKVLNGVGAGELSSLDLERFDREATVLAELVHPGIVRYVAHGVDDGAPYLAMEWVEGTTLAARLKQPFSREDSLALTRAVAEALGAAHARGIIHRDIKPSNIVLAGGDARRPMLLDFGIARHHDSDRALTQTGAIIGTPGYMAPEQARGLTTVDARADVYALGCLLFRCIAGRAPISGAHAVAVLARTIIEDAPRLAEVCPDVSHGVDDLVARLLARDPAARPADGTVVAAAIAQLTEDDTDAAPLSAIGAEAITSSQQRFVCAVLCSYAQANPARGIANLESIAVAHDARLESLADGSVLLVFVTASAPTDLAVRACHAALALVALDPSAEIAVVSGPALVRGSLPIGDLLDRAALAQRAAGRGVIALDPATVGLIGDRFVVTDERGFARLSRASAESLQTPGRTLLGRPTPCVGRDRELAFLEGLVAESVEERVARVALVVAAPGAGKSRLRRELVDRLAQREPAPLVLLGLADPVRGSAPLGLLGESLRRAAGCFDLDASTDEARHLAGWLGTRFTAEEIASAVPLLLDVAGMLATNVGRARSADTGNASVLRAWLAWLGAELEARPVVVILEDLHWGDQTTVEFLDASLRAFATKRLTVIAFARPEVKQVFPRLWVDREPQELRLGPLTRAASAALVRSVVEDSKDETVTMLVDRAGGNAFFLEELIRAHADNRAMSLPDTVLAVIHARLDALGPELTRVLRAASVFGGTFWHDGLAALLGVGTESRRLKMWLTGLIDRELIERRPETTIASIPELAFRHDLVREGAYAMLVEDDRRLAHRVAGEWLESVGTREPAALAEHYDRAGDVERAIHWSCVDAERAALAHDFSAFERAERGVRLGAKGEALGRLLAVQALMLDSGSDPRSLELAERALGLLPRATTNWYRAALVRGFRLSGGTDAATFARACSELAEAVPSPDDLTSEVEYVVTIGETIVLAARSEMPSSIMMLVGALGPYLPRASEMPPRAASCLESVLSMGSALAGLPEQALHGARRAFEHQRAAGELTHKAELTLAQRLAFVGEIDEGRRTIDRVRVEAERIGISLTISVAQYASALARSFYEEYEQAYELASGIREFFVRMRDWAVSRRLDILLAQCAFRTGRVADGEAIIVDSIARASQSSPIWARLVMVRAEGLLARGSAHEAVELVEQTRPLVQPTPFDQDAGEHALLHARALLAIGEEARARAVIEAGVADLRSIASGIENPRYREGFLSRLPSHRDLIALGAARGL